MHDKQTNPQPVSVTLDRCQPCEFNLTFAHGTLVSIISCCWMCLEFIKCLLLKFVELWCQQRKSHMNLKSLTSTLGNLPTCS